MAAEDFAEVVGVGEAAALGDGGEGVVGLDQGAAHFIHDVRPDEPVVVDGTNQVERTQDRIGHAICDDSRQLTDRGASL